MFFFFGLQGIYKLQIKKITYSNLYGNFTIQLRRYYICLSMCANEWMRQTFKGLRNPLWLFICDANSIITLYDRDEVEGRLSCCSTNTHLEGGPNKLNTTCSDPWCFHKYMSNLIGWLHCRIQRIWYNHPSQFTKGTIRKYHKIKEGKRSRMV